MVNGQFFALYTEHDIVQKTTHTGVSLQMVQLQGVSKRSEFTVYMYKKYLARNKCLEHLTVNACFFNAVHSGDALMVSHLARPIIASPSCMWKGHLLPVIIIIIVSEAAHSSDVG